MFGTNFQPPTGAKPGGTIVMGEWQPPDNLNPFYSSAFTTVEAVTPGLRGLITITSDGKYMPDLAASIPTLENGGVVITGTTFTVAVTLRSGLQWSDGTPVTMNDWKATWQFANDPAQSGCIECSPFAEISSIDVSSDGLSATLHFKELYPGWLNLIGNTFFQAKWLGTFKVADAAKSMPISSAIASVPFNGPFMITNASKTEIDYLPNPNWHGGVDLAVGGTAHAPYLAGLKFQLFDSKDGEIAAFKSGAIDLALDMTQADYSTIQGTDPTVGAAELQPAWQYEHLDVNNDPNKTRGNGLWMPDVRKAIAMSINKPDLIAAVFPGANVPPACSPTPPSLWYAKTETCPAFDDAGANALLDPIMPVGSDGNRQLAGKDVNLELCTTSGNPTRLTELQKVQGYLTAIHIKSTIKTGDAGSVVFAGWADTKPDTDCSIYRGNYDLADFAYVLTGSPYNDYYYAYDSTQFPELGDHSGSNDTRFSDPNMDAALTALKADVDPAAQQKDAGAVQDAYVGGTPEIPLYYRAETTGVGAHLGGWPMYNPSATGPTWDVEDWFSK
ncbi:MAG TPA: ABC transporter substrate-binding protein [Candidatus Limnocylindrales bacterium]|nr:ABC transporter substrate-binding protein [Candidatus Limnocylindrales bacterium]